MLEVIRLDATAAVRYAEIWAFGRNPTYADFDGMGGDCTNFISQCIHAAGAPMNLTRDVGWYYRSLNDRAAAWTGVAFFYRFIVGNRGVGPFGQEIGIGETQVGDVIQLGDETGFYHSLLVTDLIDGQPYVSAHTSDVFDRPLYSYIFDRIRVIAVRYARRESRDP